MVARLTSVIRMIFAPLKDVVPDQARERGERTPSRILLRRRDFAQARKPPAQYMTKQPGIGTSVRAASRNSFGVMPTCRLNLVQKVPRLVKPTSMQISVTVRFAERSSSCARSIRRLVRYCPGV